MDKYDVSNTFKALNERKLKIDEGSVLEFDSDNKDVQKLQSEVEKIFKMKEKIEKDLLKMEAQTGRALGLAKKIKEEDYPADTKSSGGKSSTEWSLDNFAKKTDEALEKLNTMIA